MKHGKPYTGRRALVATVGVATALTASALTGGSDVKGACEVPVGPKIAAEGASGLAGELGVDATQLSVTGANGAPADGTNHEMTIDRSNAFEPDVAVPVLVEGDTAAARGVGKAACAAVQGTFTPSGPAGQ